MDSVGLFIFLNKKNTFYNIQAIRKIIKPNMGEVVVTILNCIVNPG